MTKKKDDFNIEEAVRAYSARRKELRGNPVDNLFAVLKELLLELLGDQPTAIETKEGLYIIKYIQGIIANAIQYYDTYKRLPLLQYTLFGDCSGGSLVDLYMSPDMGLVESFKLRDLALSLKETTDDWGAQKPQDEIEQLDMIKNAVQDMGAYSAIQDHIKTSGTSSEGSEEEK